MKSVVLQLLSFTASVFLILLLSSIAYAFPSVHTDGFLLQSSTSGSGGPYYLNMVAGTNYYATTVADPIINTHNDGGQSPPSVPEPATVALLGLGLIGMGLLQRRRRHKSS